MSVDLAALGAILAMALASYMTRAGGLLLSSLIAPTPFFEAWMRQVPGAMFVALVAPAIAKGGPPEWAGTAVALVVARLKLGLPLALAGALATVALIRFYA